MMERNADGTVNHDGEYNPWADLDEQKARECRESGGFVMRTGHVILGGRAFGRDAPNRHIGDGLMYVVFTPTETGKPKQE